MPVQLTNRASSLLASSIDDSTTTILLTSDTEGRFPSPSGGDWFPVTVADPAGNVENMRCTARAGVVLTVQRGQEGSAARAFDAGARVELRLTAGALEAAMADSDRLATPLPDLVLPPRLKHTLQPSGNLNQDLGTGFYYAEAGTDNAPLSQAGFVWHLRIDANNRYQEYLRAGTQQRFVRQMIDGAFGAWEQPYLTRAEALALRLPGEVVPYLGATEPTGWLFLAGQVILRATYPELDAAVYVGDALNATAPALYRTTTLVNPGTNRSTTGPYLVLPDGRGRGLIGRDNMGGTAASRITQAVSGFDGSVLAASGGAQAVTLVTANMPKHKHSGETADGGERKMPVGTNPTGGNGTFVSRSFEGLNPAELPLLPPGPHKHTFETNEVGGDAPHRNVQPSLVANLIVKT